MPVQEFQEPPEIAFARLAHPAPHCLLHQHIPVARQDFGNAEGVVEIVLPYEEIGGDDGRAALAWIGGAGELVENFARLAREIAAHHIRRAAVNQVPGVNPVVAPDVEIEHLLAAGIGCRLGAGLPVHDADGAHAHLMERAVEQLFDFRWRHVGEFLGQGKDLSHRDASGLAQVFGKFIGAQFFMGNG